MTRFRSALLFAALCAVAPLTAFAQTGAGTQQRDAQRLHATDGDDGTGAPIFGHQLMTREEIAAHRMRMQAATPQERQRIRTEHHRLMVERARERGITLPGEPPPRGGGQGPGARQGGAGNNRPQSGN